MSNLLAVVELIDGARNPSKDKNCKKDNSNDSFSNTFHLASRPFLTPASRFI